MRVFITGINGFVGGHLSNLLLSRKYEVSGIGILGNFYGNKKANYYEVNLLNPNKLEQILSQVKPQLIFHLAGFSSVKKSFEQPGLCKKINVTGTKNLLDAVIDSKINPKILVVSSAEVYGIPQSVPIKETADLNPKNPYGASKKEQEGLCKKYMEKLHIIVSRSFPHIGPGQQPLFVMSDFAKQIAEIEKGKKPVINVGNLEAERDFTDVRDIVKAYLLSLQKCIHGEFYNICSKKAYSIKKVLNMLLSMSNAKIDIKIDPKKMRASDIPVLLGDNEKFCRQTGWKPKIQLKKTLKDLLDYWREKIK
tara:strand:+ start:1452 stop:2375 length:924 start_codon:yes stop_codon:yes gene_type:complete